MEQPFERGARVERLASPHAYFVPVGTLGTVVGAFAEPDAVPRPKERGYLVQWDPRPAGSPDFAAGSRLRVVLDVVAVPG